MRDPRRRVRMRAPGSSAALREVAEQQFDELTPVTVSLKTTRSSHLDSVEQLVEGVDSAPWTR